MNIKKQIVKLETSKQSQARGDLKTSKPNQGHPEDYQIKPKANLKLVIQAKDKQKTSKPNQGHTEDYQIKTKANLRLANKDKPKTGKP